jgi:ABC-type polysaccharide/polyol phosphate transport system ATPase subunit
MPIIEADNITKRFRARRGGRVLLGREGIRTLIRGDKAETVPALDQVSFDVESGESLGIIGTNGSGKSTLLKIIAGVTVPTEGDIRVHGRVASLLELGAGFHPMLSGRENVYLNAGILGMRRKYVHEVFDQILEFSGIGKFIDYPVDTYSSGMYVRLAFAVAAHTNPDIFLIDEVLSVGDETFQRRCRNRIGELMEMGKTILFVSHDLGIVNSLCNRVILLNKGKMILRDSSSKAIDFYLRQIGAEKGLHSMANGPLEAIMCNGRISVFYNQEEVTSSYGLQFQIFNFGFWHNSKEADWTITDRTDTSCTARGYVAKISATFVWTIALIDDQLLWTIGIHCDSKLEADTLEANLHFPTDYTQWTYDDGHGTFEELRPEDTNWLGATNPELLCETAALLPDDDSDRPAIVLNCESQRAHVRGSWTNSDYMTGCRVFQSEDHLGKERSLGEGDHDLLVFRIQAGANKAALKEQLGQKGERQTVTAGKLKGRFDRGRIRLSYDGELLTDVIHLYASLLIQNLWHDSVNVRWDSVEREDDLLRFVGSSRRAPLRMIWEIQPEGDAMGLTIWIDALEAVEVQEYHTSIILKEEFTEWETDHESGAFPAFTPEMHDWQHLNTNYAAASFEQASGPDQPTVRLEADDPDVPIRMTTLNTGHQQRGRVLQALCTPDHGVFHLEPGKHLHFKGRIVVTEC